MAPRSLQTLQGPQRSGGARARARARARRSSWATKRRRSGRARTRGAPGRARGKGRACAGRRKRGDWTVHGEEAGVDGRRGTHLTVDRPLHPLQGLQGFRDGKSPRGPENLFFWFVAEGKKIFCRPPGSLGPPQRCKPCKRGGSMGGVGTHLLSIDPCTLCKVCKV